jgi:hypothetical protein
VNALADPRVAKYLNDHFVSTYMKVGAFKIINGQKVGGNVASYFCQPDGIVIHAFAGQTNANKFLGEARWATDVRKSAQIFAVNLKNDIVDPQRFASYLRKAHGERFHEENQTWGDRTTIPVQMPRIATPQAQTHWLLAKNPANRLDTIYPVVWREILRETLSDLPVEKR